jgi:hypothetical protein
MEYYEPEKWALLVISNAGAEPSVELWSPVLADKAFALVAHASAQSGRPKHLASMRPVTWHAFDNAEWPTLIFRFGLPSLIGF